MRRHDGKQERDDGTRRPDETHDDKDKSKQAGGTVIREREEHNIPFF